MEASCPLPFLARAEGPVWRNILSFVLMDILFGWSGNPVFSMSPWYPLIPTLFFCPDSAQDTLFLWGWVWAPRKGRWNLGQIWELCPSLLLVMLVKLIKGICSPIHSAFSSWRMRTESQRGRGFQPELLPVLSRVLPLFLLHWSLSCFCFSLSVPLSQSLNFWASMQIRKREDQGIAEFKWTSIVVWWKIPSLLPPKHSKRKCSNKPAAPPELSPLGQCHKVDTIIPKLLLA